MATAPVGFHGALQSRLYLDRLLVASDAVIGLAKYTASVPAEPWLVILGCDRQLQRLLLFFLADNASGSCYSFWPAASQSTAVVPGLLLWSGARL